MAIDDYFEVEKPEAKTIIEVKTNPLAAVVHAYDVWIEQTKKFSLNENLYEAERLLTPLDDVLPEVLGDEYIRAVQERGRRNENGLFYTALLNTGEKTRRLHVDIPQIPRMGYGLKKGILEMHAYAQSIGTAAVGGCIICHEHCVNLGAHSKNTLYVALGGAIPGDESSSIFITFEYPIFPVFADNIFITYREEHTTLSIKQKFFYVHNPDFLTKINKFFWYFLSGQRKRKIRLQELVHKTKLAALDQRVDEIKIRTLVGKIEELCKHSV